MFDYVHMRPEGVHCPRMNAVVKLLHINLKIILHINLKITTLLTCSNKN